MEGKLKIVFIIFLLGIQNALSGQVDTLMTQQIEDVVISASKISGSLSRLPSSVSKIELDQEQVISQQYSLQEYVRTVPGLFTLNANNQAQDLRISLRGFGSRAAFGIRGIKLIVDGVPETTPDGQGQLDNLNLGIVDNIEVLRGPSSALYGNASGGVISINTIDKIDTSYSLFGVGFGSFGFQQYSWISAIKKEKTNFILHGAYNTSSGYRVQSDFQNINFNARVSHRFSEKSKLNFNINYSNSPTANDAGGVNISDVEADRKQARDRNVLFATGEEIKQLKLSSNYRYGISKGKRLESYGFLATRDFYGKLPFGFGGIVDLDRIYFGQGSSLTLENVLQSGINKFQIGYDLAVQRDERQRFFNNDGTQGDKTFDQKESFLAAGLYIVDHFTSGLWQVNGGLRLDLNKLSAEDRFLTNGDASGDLNLSSINPSIGVSYRLGTYNSVFINWSTSFETPTLSELSNNPSGAEGLNTALKPQKASNFEIGLKGELLQNGNASLQYGLTVFNILTRDDLVPFELEAFPDRNFFRNAGNTKRRGLELSANYQIANDWDLTASYTYSDFIYQEYELPSGSFAGNYLPGIPKSFGAIHLKKTAQQGFILNLDMTYTGTLYTSDNNETRVDGYTLINAQLGYKAKLGSSVITPYVGINNLTSVEYFDNIRINAFGSRFYEPAPTRHYFLGLKAKF